MSKSNKSQKFSGQIVNNLFGNVHKDIKQDETNKSNQNNLQSRKNKGNQHKSHLSKHSKSKSSKFTSTPKQIKRVSNYKSTKSKSKKATKNKDDEEFSSVRLTVRAIARLNAYQKVSGLKNRSDALNTVLDKALPLLLNNTQKTSAKVIEKLFESNHNGNTK